MRVIKFRAWDKKGKGFINGFNMFGFSMGQGAATKKLQRFNSEWYEEDIEIMQYTGLNDKNGKMIFESDIIKNPQGDYEQVVFVNGCFQTADIKVPNRNLFLLDTYSTFIEVVGNIYYNPELMN